MPILSNKIGILNVKRCNIFLDYFLVCLSICESNIALFTVEFFDFILNELFKKFVFEMLPILRAL
jgi:hypothetical protein